MAKKSDNIADADLIKKYGHNAFMYGEYPHKSFWANEADDGNYRAALKDLALRKKNAPALLYVHVPFCPKQCYFCTCRTKMAQNYGIVTDYLGLLHREIDLLKNFLEKDAAPINFQEIHIGGGSPSWLRKKDFDALVDKLGTIADIKKLYNFTLEVDPRQVNEEKMLYYCSKGIDRVSFGIQDFDPDVQKAINRVQPVKLIESLLTAGVRERAGSVNFDIICGLPRQTRESFRRTIDSAVKLSPERISLLFLIYAPEFSKHQKLLKRSEFPAIHEQILMFEESMRTLLSSGYVRIGVEHFAKPTDSLAKALKNKTLFWGGGGYATGKYHDIIGIGTSSAARVTDRWYFQNTYDLPDYEAGLKNDKFPVYRSCRLSDDDLIRRDIIHDLRCYFSIDPRAVEAKYKIAFKSYFKKELAVLEEFSRDGVLDISPDRAVRITERGKLFTNYICSVFDSFIGAGRRG